MLVLVLVLLSSVFVVVILGRKSEKTVVSHVFGVFVWFSFLFLCGSIVQVQ